jgi:hypothetical protein
MGHQHTTWTDVFTDTVRTAGQVIGARVYRTSDQSIPNGTNTIITYNAENFDTDALHDLISFPSRLTCTVAGEYLITTQARFAGNSAGFRYVTPLLNGSIELAIMRVPPASGVDTDISCSTIYRLQVGDYIETRVYQNSGGALNVIGAANFSPHLAMVRLRS